MTTDTHYSTTQAAHAAPIRTPKDPGKQPVAPEVFEERVASFSIKDEILEQVSKGGEHSFVSKRRDGTPGTCRSRRIEGGRVLTPLTPRDLRACDLRLPSEPIQYGSVEDLDKAILAHVRKYSRMPAEIEPIIPLYIRYTWLADQSRTAPYLRISGPSGSGKSRTARVIGHLCNKAYMTNSCASPAALYRNMARIGRHTLVLDENEHDGRSETQGEITKILKLGFEEDGAVERCVEVAKNGERAHEVERHPVFGPKIICAIAHVPDRALRSRCIPVRMTKSREVPVELPTEYEAETAELRNRLLQYRLDHFFAPRQTPAPLALDGRLNQLYLPLAKVATSGQVPILRGLMHQLQADLAEEAEGETDHKLARAIWQVAEKALGQHGGVSFSEVVTYAESLQATVTPQEVGLFVKDLGLKSERPKGKRGPRCIVGTGAEVIEGLRRAGYDFGGAEERGELLGAAA